MVVLEGGSMMSVTPSNQYLSPDYLPPLPSVLDTKNSPLALLAQTCSQIGADNSTPKPLLASAEKPKKSCNTDRPSISINGNSSKSYVERKSPENKLAFKPYEINVLTKKNDSTRPTSRSVDSGFEDRKSSSRTSSRKSASSSPHNSSSNSPAEKPSSPNSAHDMKTYDGHRYPDIGKSSSPVAIESSSLSKSNAVAEMYNLSKESAASSFKPAFPLSPLSAANYGCTGCPTSASLDATNPAFRSPFVGSHFPHHPSLLDACFQSSAAAAAAAANSFMSYTRVKTPSGNEAVVPVCKDPYCLSCRFALHGAVGPCPPGCVQCDQKYSAAAAAAAALMSHPLSYQYTRPFVCSWISGDAYCGKRFRSSDELLQHLRTHTSANEALAFMNQLRYPPSSSASANVNALAASARYHPYSKPGLPISLAASPFSAFNPTLSPYYSPYSLYEQRIGAAVNP